MYSCIRCSTTYSKEHLPLVKECYLLQEEAERCKEKYELVLKKLRLRKMQLLNLCLSYESTQYLKIEPSKEILDNRTQTPLKEKNPETDPQSAATRSLAITLIIFGFLSFVFPSIFYVLGLGLMILGVMSLFDSCILLFSRSYFTLKNVTRNHKKKGDAISWDLN